MNHIRLWSRLTNILMILCSPALAACRADPPPLVLCCAGDSIMRPMPAYLRQSLPALRPDFVLHEWARGGLSTATYQGFYREQAEEWRRVRPDLILLQIGTDDVVPVLEGRSTLEDFKANLSRILMEFKSYRTAAGEPPCLLVATIPFFSDIPSNQDKNHLVKADINPAIRSVAGLAGAVIVDNFAVLEGKEDLYDPDGVPPNPRGEAAVAENWVRAIRSLLEEKQ